MTAFYSHHERLPPETTNLPQKIARGSRTGRPRHAPRRLTGLPGRMSARALCAVRAAGWLSEVGKQAHQQQAPHDSRPGPGPTVRLADRGAVMDATVIALITATV